MLWFHPVLQLAATLLGFYVLWLGLARFSAVHLGRKRPFPWKRHVRLGTAAVALWSLGLVGGLATTRLHWGEVGDTGAHYRAAMLLLPLLAFSLASGLVMDKRKKTRAVLPLLHAANNLLLLALAVYQAITGWGVIREYLFL